MGKDSKPMITLFRDFNKTGNFVIKNDTFTNQLPPEQVP